MERDCFVEIRGRGGLPEAFSIHDRSTLHMRLSPLGPGASNAKWSSQTPEMWSRDTGQASTLPSTSRTYLSPSRRQTQPLITQAHITQSASQK